MSKNRNGLFFVLKQRRAWGLSLIELLLALAILGVVTSIAYPSYREFILRAEIAQAIADILSLDFRIERYNLETGGYPDTLDDIGGSPLDPWGAPYEYLGIEAALSKDKGKGKDKDKGRVRKDKSLHPLNSDYDLYSKGPDGRSNAPLTAKVSRDDIIRAGNGTFVGIAENY